MTRPDYDLSEKQVAFVAKAEDEGFTVRFNYSGRGMYGRYCPAVVCDPGDFGFRGAATDQMGHRIVVYMP